MFEFPIFITLLITLIVGYISIFFTFKKEIDDLRIDSKSNQDFKTNKDIELKIKERIKLLINLTIVFLFLLVVIIILYIEPLIWEAIQSINIDEIICVIYKIAPYNEELFLEPKFIFSYITGRICSGIIVSFVYFYLFYIFDGAWKDIFVALFISVVMFFILIWINFLISFLLSYSIIHSFELLSLLINITINSLIFILLFIILKNIRFRKKSKIKKIDYIKF